MNYYHDIKNFLDKKVEIYNKYFFIEQDPIQIPHIFSKKEDIEISGFLTSLLSWGRRKTTIEKAKYLMNIMDNSPYDFVMNHNTIDLNYLRIFKHRTIKGEDIIFFIKSLKKIYNKYHGLESLFYIKETEINTQNAIKRFRKILFSFNHEKRTEKHISDPDKGSACKKLNMYLRWMTRKDNKVDLGLWNSIPMSKLSCPLDIHSTRVAKKLGLLSRKKNDIKSVIEIDSILRIFDKKDPVKYDFALFGLGKFENF